MCRELAKSCVWWLGLSKQTKSRIAIGCISEKERALQSTSAQTSAVYQDGRVPLAVCWKWFFKRNVISSYWSSITFLDESRHLMQTATPAVIRFVIFNILSSLVIKSQRSCFNQTMVPSSTLGISLCFSDFLFHIPFFSLFFSPFFFLSFSSSFMHSGNLGLLTWVNCCKSSTTHSHRMCDIFGCSNKGMAANAWDL